MENIYLFQHTGPSLFKYTVLEDGSLEFPTWDDAVFYADKMLLSNFTIQRDINTGKAKVKVLCPTSQRS